MSDKSYENLVDSKQSYCNNKDTIFDLHSVHVIIYIHREAKQDPKDLILQSIY